MHRLSLFVVAAIAPACALGPSAGDMPSPALAGDEVVASDAAFEQGADGTAAFVDSPFDLEAATRTVEAGADGPGGPETGGASAGADATTGYDAAPSQADATIDAGGAMRPSCAGPFTLANQQPIECLPYPDSLWNKPLPADVMGHLAANSDAIVAGAFSDHGQFTYPWPRAQALGVVSTVTSGGQDNDSPLYYGQPSDPAYVVADCPGDAPSRATVGTIFHAPNAAPFSFEGGGDSFFADWDQPSNVLFAAYDTSATWVKLPQCPGGGHAGTDADPCPASFQYCAASNWTTSQGLGMSAGDSLGSGGWALHDRSAEMIAGAIHHAQYLETDCTVGYVFPAWTGTFACPAGTTNKPPEGALFFLDYTPVQLAAIKNSVPLWQYELIEALTVYGGYVGDTHGAAEGLPITRFEGPAAYNQAGIPFALGDWFLSFAGGDAGPDAPLACYHDTNGQDCEFNPYVGVPLETGPSCPSTPCDVSKHMHLADPCVAEGLAGKPGGCN